jgi:hypothetical protein
MASTSYFRNLTLTTSHYALCASTEKLKKNAMVLHRSKKLCLHTVEYSCWYIMLVVCDGSNYRIGLCSRENMTNSPLRHRAQRQISDIVHCFLLNGLWGCEFPEPKDSIWLSDIASLLLYSGHWDLEFP